MTNWLNKLEYKINDTKTLSLSFYIFLFLFYDFFLLKFYLQYFLCFNSIIEFFIYNFVIWVFFFLIFFCPLRIYFSTSKSDSLISNKIIKYLINIKLVIMASKPVAQLSAPEKEQLAVSYAAFVLSGQGAQVTAEAINSVLSAAGLTASVNLVKAFAKTLATRQVTDLIGSIGSSEAPAAEVPAAKAPAKGAEKAAKTAPPPPPAEEEEGMDMGGLFD